MRNQRQNEPLAVGRPLVREAVVVGVVVLLAVRDLAHLFRCYVIDFQNVAILDKGNFLAVGRISRRDALDAVVVEERLFVNQSGIGEVVVFLALDGSLVEVPVTVTFRSIYEGSAILRERRAALGLRRVRDLLGGGVFVHASDEHLAARNEGNQLAVVAQREVVGTLEVLFHQLLWFLVVHDFDAHLLWLTSNALRVNLAHVAVAQQAVVGHAQEAHWVRLEVRYLFRVFEVVGRRFIHVEVALVALAQENNFLITGQIARVAILADVSCQHRVGLFLGVVIDHIAGHGRNVVLAPFVLAALAVVVEERLAVLVERHATHRHGHHLLRPTAFDRHLIQFGNPARGKLHIFNAFHHLGREINLFPVGRESQRHFAG